MAINIQTQNLIPVRRDGQTALTIGGGFATTIIGSNASTGGIVDTTGLLKESSINIGSILSLEDFVWINGIMYVNDLTRPAGGGSASKTCTVINAGNVSTGIYVMSASDYEKEILVDRTTPFIVRIPTGLTENKSYTFTQMGAGQITFDACVGVTAYKGASEYAQTDEQWSSVEILCISTNRVFLRGKLETIGAVDTSLTSVWTKFGYVDTSLNNIWTKIGNIDTSISNIPAITDMTFGAGTDGDVTISGTTTLTRNMYYNNLTVNTGQILNTAGFLIYVKGTLTLSGTGSIQCKGGDGGAGTTTGGAGGGGNGGTAPYTTQRFPFQPIPSGGGGGGTGGTVAGTTNAGASGAGSAVALSLAGTTNYPIQLYVGAGASGGGGHGNSPSVGSAASPTYIFYGVAGKSGGTPSGTGSFLLGGGGGGAGGGCMIVYCNILSGSGTFNVAGGNGGNGLTNTTTYSGNGGGGNGGSATVYYRTQSSWTGSFVATGGNAGTGGTGGVAGALGTTSLVQI